MKRKCVLIVFLILVACSPSKPSDKVAENPSTHQEIPAFNLPDSSYTILHLDSITTHLFEQATASELTPFELTEIEGIIDSTLNLITQSRYSKWKEYNNQFPESPWDSAAYTVDTRNFKRQYLPVIVHGEKIVWINFFCRDAVGKWKSFPVFVRDGGDCYFNLKVNLSSGTCYDIQINGEA